MADTLTDLSAACVDAQPVDVDWSEGYGETWERVWPDWATDSRQTESALSDYGDGMATLCDECGIPVVLRFGLGWEHDDQPDITHDPAPQWSPTLFDDLNEAILDSDPDAFAPTWPYAYPIELSMSAEAAQALLWDLPVVVVLYDPDGTWNTDPENDAYLALSGGGMDLSWEICEAYLRLGLLPPMHFCDLPQMAGRGSGHAWRKRPAELWTPETQECYRCDSAWCMIPEPPCLACRGSKCHSPAAATDRAIIAACLRTTDVIAGRVARVREALEAL